MYVTTYVRIRMTNKVHVRLVQVELFVHTIQCQTGQVSNNTDRISTLTGLSMFDQEVRCLAGMRRPLGLSLALSKFFHHFTFIVPPYSMSYLCISLSWL